MRLMYYVYVQTHVYKNSYSQERVCMFILYVVALWRLMPATLTSPGTEQVHPKILRLEHTEHRCLPCI